METIDSRTAPAVTAPATPLSDADALARMRSGDHDAYVILYERHGAAARRLASQLLPRSDVDDVVAEVFAASFAAIRRGRGPRDDFGPYVLSAVRRECYRSLRRRGRRRETPAEPDEVERSAVLVEPADHAERAVLETAFGSLAPNLQTVLWLTEVEGLSHGEIAVRTASTGPAVAAMAMRARRALAEQYLDAHSADTAARLPRDCREARKSLAGVVRGTASERKQRRVEEHVARCVHCAGVRDQLQTVNHRLRHLAPPLLVASLGSVRLFPGGLRGQWAGWTGGHGAAAVAVGGAMTASVVLPSAIDRNLPDTFGDATAATAAAPNASTGASPTGADEAGEPSEPGSSTERSGSPGLGSANVPVGGSEPSPSSGGGSVELAPWAWPIAIPATSPTLLAPPPSGEVPPEPTSPTSSGSDTTTPEIVTVPGTLLPPPGTVPSTPQISVPATPAVTLPPAPEVTTPVTAPVSLPVSVPDVGIDPDVTTPTAPVTAPALPTPDVTVGSDVPSEVTAVVGSGVDSTTSVDGPLAETPAPTVPVTVPSAPLGAAPVDDLLGD